MTEDTRLLVDILECQKSIFETMQRLLQHQDMIDKALLFVVKMQCQHTRILASTILCSVCGSSLTIDDDRQLVCSSCGYAQEKSSDEDDDECRGIY